MIVLALGCLVLAVLVWVGRLTGSGAGQGQWRVPGGFIALAGLVAAVVLSARGEWYLGLPLLVLSGLIALIARMRRPIVRPVTAPEGMSLAEARSILGVGEGATETQIKAAYTRLMLMAHPDQGGTAGLAAQLNAARDRLLRG